MKHKSVYYVVNFIVPCITMSTLNLGVFLLPTNSGDRVTVGTAIFMSYSVFLLVIQGELPTTSEYFPLIFLYLVGLVILSTLVILMNILIISMRNTPHKRVPICFKTIWKCIQYSEYCLGKNEESQPMKSDQLWNKYVEAVDKVMFLLFIFALVFVTFTYLGLCLSNG